MPKGVPEVAQCEDYDSDESSVKPGTRKEARRKTTGSGPPKALNRYRTGRRDSRVATSDSGYSSQYSYASISQGSNSPAIVQAAPPVQPPVQPPTVQGNTSKPMIHRTDSRQSNQTVPARSSSTSRQSRQCDDLTCRHPACLQVRNLERRYSISSQSATQYATQYTTSPAQYQQPAQPYQYQYARMPPTTSGQTVPQLTPQRRPSSTSTSRQARPMSFHGYTAPNAYSGQQGQQAQVPTTAYQDPNYVAWVQAYQQQQRAYQQAAAYGTTPPTQAIPLRTHTSPITTSPTSPNFATAPGLQRTYSARTTTIPGIDSSNIFPTSKPYSARQSTGRMSTMPGAYPSGTQQSSESTSDSSDSESEYSEEDVRDSRSRQWDNRRPSASSSRRPSIKRQHATAPVVPTRASREILHRNLRSENTLDYISGSDNMDSDRTARAVVDRPRTTYTGSTRSSRRPSLSTNASSNRTRATTMSSMSGLNSEMANLVLERNGRNITYLSKRDQVALEYGRQQLEERQRLEDRVEAYQNDIRGSQPPELTADNIYKQQVHAASSRASGHSRKGSRSSSKVPQGEAVKIESNGTVIHVYPGSKVQMRSDGDGQSTFVIGSSSGGKDSSYYSASKSSSESRRGRSRGASEFSARRKSAIQEEAVTDQSDA